MKAGGFGLETSAKSESEKAFRLRQTGNEGIRRILPAQAGRAGLILLLSEKLPRNVRGRRAQRDRYPDFGHDLAPAFPPVLTEPGQWPWEFVVRNSGATVADFHGVPWQRAA